MPPKTMTHGMMIAARGQRLDAVRPDELDRFACRFVPFAIADADRRAALGERHGNRAPDAPRTAGNDGHAAS